MYIIGTTYTYVHAFNETKNTFNFIIKVTKFNELNVGSRNISIST